MHMRQESYWKILQGNRERRRQEMSLRLGEIQKLEIVKKVEFGVYLAEPGREDDKVLLPIKQVPAGASVGDVMEVFLYKDSKDRLIATTKRPKLIMGEATLLTVAQMGKIGAFLDWGLEKDLLLPFKQQRGRIREGDQVLVSLYVDKSERLCATMNVYEHLLSNSSYKKDDRVSGRVYEISNNFGAFVAVDDKYSALIPKNELFGEIEPGQIISARVIKVQDDGRLLLSIREKAYLQIDKDAEKILQLLDSYEGSLPFTDKSAPEVITHETGMSKNEFKRAVGHLLKEKKIQIGEKSIRRL
jgi:predicted RNA-binding protein (virulence factor B family)